MEGELNLMLLAYRLFWGFVASVLTTAICVRVSCLLYNKLFAVVVDVQRPMSKPEARLVAPQSVLLVEQSQGDRSAPRDEELVPVEIVDATPRSRRRGQWPTVAEGGVPMPTMMQSLRIALYVASAIGGIWLALVLMSYGLASWVSSLEPSNSRSRYGGGPDFAYVEAFSLVAVAAVVVLIMAACAGSLMATAAILRHKLGIPLGRAVVLSCVQLGTLFVASLLAGMLIVVIWTLLGWGALMTM